MNLTKTDRKRSRARGHTLVELLAAVAVVSLMLLLIFQIVQGVLQATRSQNKKIEATDIARRVLDVMTADIQSIPFSAGATLLAPANSGANLFYAVTARRGNDTSSPPRFLAVGYTLRGTNQLFRSYGGVDYGRSDLLAASLAVTSLPPVPLANGVLAVQLRAVTGSTNYPLASTPGANWATNNYNGFQVPGGYSALVTPSSAFALGLTNTTHSIQVWIAVVDPQNHDLLSKSGKLSMVTNALGSDPSSWRSQVDALSIPSPAKAGVRIFSKNIPLH